MGFDIPLDTPAASKRTGEDRSKNTIKLYKTYLNKLANMGYTTKKDLVEKQIDVVNDIKKNVLESNGNTTVMNQKTRIFLSAIYYVLHDVSYSDLTAYYELFQVSNDKTKKEYHASK